MTTLDKVKTGGLAVIKNINTSPDLKQRLFDIGMLPLTQVKVLHQSPLGNPRAYLVRGTVIALRNADAAEILVEVTEADE